MFAIRKFTAFVTGRRWKAARRFSRGFTLPEMLVVICVIALLAGMVANTANSARERARQTNCLNNLRQFGAALVIYRADRKTNPDWLTDLYPDYIDNRTQFVCRSDEKNGDNEYGDPVQRKYGDVLDKERDNLQRDNSDVDQGRCSYLYEFNGDAYPGGDKCSNADTDGNGTVSWGEQKMHVLAGGCGSDCPAIKSSHTKRRPSSSRLPIVRCFHHQKSGRIRGYLDEKATSTSMQPIVLNVAYEGNVYASPPWWEGTVEPGDK